MPKTKPLQRSYDTSKFSNHAPSARLTRQNRDRIPYIHFDLKQQGINPRRWELEVLARGGSVTYDRIICSYAATNEWPVFL